MNGNKYIDYLFVQVVCVRRNRKLRSETKINTTLKTSQQSHLLSKLKENEHYKHH